MNKREKKCGSTALCHASCSNGETFATLADKTARPKVVPRDPRAKSRGQITAEFIITLIILFSLFSLVAFVSAQQKENTDFNSKKIKAKTLMENTARGVNGIYLAGEGTETIMAKEFDFEIEFEENTLKVKYGQGQFVSTSLLTKKIIHSTKSANPKRISIKNAEGVVKVEEF